MLDETVQELDRALESGNGGAGLEFLISKARETHNSNLLFEAMLMKARHELQLPLIQTQATAEFPAEKRTAYDRAVVEAAKDAGNLALENGDIPAAWPYFRAVGEMSRVADAIDKVNPGEADLDPVIAIAFNEGVHPAKGLELILAQHGMCRAITSFGMYPVQAGRAKCIALLVRGLHAEVIDRMGHAIEAREGSRPVALSIPETIGGRDWMFGQYDYYVDNSHLMSLLPYCLEVNDREVLSLFDELCQYGERLDSGLQAGGQPPFEQPFIDYGHYVRARLGEDLESHLDHFRRKLAEADPIRDGTAPAQLLVRLLAEVRMYSEAIEVSLKYLQDVDYEMACPGILQLCHMGGDYSRMAVLSRDRGDMLSYLAASVMQRESK